VKLVLGERPNWSEAEVEGRGRGKLNIWPYGVEGMSEADAEGMG
jgi:hypothetical protein